MFRINTDIDKYIMDDKVKIKIDKKRKITKVSFDKIYTNNTNEPKNQNRNSKSSDASFDENLKEEIQKIIQKKD